jgi:hypothetical protein
VVGSFWIKSTKINFSRRALLHTFGLREPFFLMFHNDTLASVFCCFEIYEGVSKKKVTDTLLPELYSDFDVYMAQI